MAPKRKPWTPKELTTFTVVGTACLCLIILILGVILGVLTGRISVDALGTLNGLSIGTGLLGFGLLLFWIIKISLSGGGSSGNSRG